MVYLLKMVIFYSYVNLPEGMSHCIPINPKKKLFAVCISNSCALERDFLGLPLHQLVEI